MHHKDMPDVAGEVDPPCAPGHAPVGPLPEIVDLAVTPPLVSPPTASQPSPQAAGLLPRPLVARSVLAMQSVSQQSALPCVAVLAGAKSNFAGDKDCGLIDQSPGCGDKEMPRAGAGQWRDSTNTASCDWPYARCQLEGNRDSGHIAFRIDADDGGKQSAMLKHTGYRPPPEVEEEDAWQRDDWLTGPQDDGLQDWDHNYLPEPQPAHCQPDGDAMTAVDNQWASAQPSEARPPEMAQPDCSITDCGAAKHALGEGGPQEGEPPWYYRFPDFVPVAMLAHGRNPRYHTVAGCCSFQAVALRCTRPLALP